MPGVSQYEFVEIIHNIWFSFGNQTFLTKHRPLKKYNEPFRALLIKFSEARGKGHHVN